MFNGSVRWIGTVAFGVFSQQHTSRTNCNSELRSNEAEIIVGLFCKIKLDPQYGGEYIISEENSPALSKTLWVGVLFGNTFSNCINKDFFYHIVTIACHICGYAVGRVRNFSTFTTNFLFFALLCLVEFLLVTRLYCLNTVSVYNVFYLCWSSSAVV